MHILSNWPQLHWIFRASAFSGNFPPTTPINQHEAILSILFILSKNHWRRIAVNISLMRRATLLLLLLTVSAFGANYWLVHLRPQPKEDSIASGLDAARAKYKPSFSRPQSSWESIAPGLELSRQSLGGGPFVTLRTTPGRIHIASRGQLLNASEWRRQCNALAAINGGFFDQNHRSLGIRIAEGRTLSGSSGSKGGVFYVQAGRAHIVASTDFTPNSHITQAVQCGPRLVEHGRPQQLKPQFARRTGIGIQLDGRVVVAVADYSMSLPEWARLWASPEGLNCIDALNLDGGPSTQLSLHAGTQNVEILGGWPVPDAVVIR